MDIVVYLNNGQIHDFAQHDPEAVRAMLTDFQANRLFAASSLIFGSGASCLFVKTSAISRIDIVTDEPLAVHPTIKDEARLIEDEQAFEQRARAAAKAFADGVAPGEEYLGYMRFLLAGRFTVQLELKRRLQQQVQFFTNLHRLFETGLICFPHPHGGIVILNVSNIVSVDATPGFAEYPKGTLVVDAQ